MFSVCRISIQVLVERLPAVVGVPPLAALVVLAALAALLGFLLVTPERQDWQDYSDCQKPVVRNIGICCKDL